MLIDFSPDGKVQFTRNPTLLSLFPGMRKRVTRMSEIIFSEEHQFYYIKLLTGAHGGKPLCWEIPDLIEQGSLDELWYLFTREHSPGLVRDLCECIDPSFPVFFREYEDAVKVEVEFIDYLREQGVSVQ